MFSVGESLRENLPLAFVATLSSVIDKFQSITIRGKLNPECKIVNIAIKPIKCRSTAALDLNIDVSKRAVEFHHMVNNRLQTSEDNAEYLIRYRQGKNWEVALDPNEMFTILIINNLEEFLISINEQKIFSYSQTHSLSMNVVEVRGDVDRVTQFDFRTFFPIAIPATQYQTDANVFSLEYPHLLFPGLIILINAIVTGPPDGMFVVYFPSTYRLRTILWFGVDFATRTIGRKTMDEQMKYKKEEYDGPFPIEMNKEFRMAFGFSETHFLFAINGEIIPSYPYPNQVPRNQFNAPLFNSLMGPKVNTHKGLDFKAISVFNHIGPSSCPEYDLLSNTFHKVIV